MNSRSTFDDGSGGEIGDFISDPDWQSPDIQIDADTVTEKTHALLKVLTPREAKMIRMRFGIREKQEHTLQEIADRHSVSRERIRQVEAKALRKLRLPAIFAGVA